VAGVTRGRRGGRRRERDLGGLADARRGRARSEQHDERDDHDRERGRRRHEQRVAPAGAQRAAVLAAAGFIDHRLQPSPQRVGRRNVDRAQQRNGALLFGVGGVCDLWIGHLAIHLV